jgi:hypothetical protein
MSGQSYVLLTTWITVYLELTNALDVQCLLQSGFTSALRWKAGSIMSLASAAQISDQPCVWFYSIRFPLRMPEALFVLLWLLQTPRTRCFH